MTYRKYGTTVTVEQLDEQGQRLPDVSDLRLVANRP